MIQPGAEFSSAREARLTYRWCIREMKKMRAKMRGGYVDYGEVQHLSRTLSARARQAYVWLQERGQAVHLSAEEVFYQDWRRTSTTEDSST